MPNQSRKWEFKNPKLCWNCEVFPIEPPFEDDMGIERINCYFCNIAILASISDHLKLTEKDFPEGTTISELIWENVHSQTLQTNRIMYQMLKGQSRQTWPRWAPSRAIQSRQSSLPRRHLQESDWTSMKQQNSNSTTQSGDENLSRFCEITRHQCNHTVRCPKCLRFVCGKHIEHNHNKKRDGLTISGAVSHLIKAIGHRLVTMQVERLASKIESEPSIQPSKEDNEYDESKALSEAN